MFCAANGDDGDDDDDENSGFNAETVIAFSGICVGSSVTGEIPSNESITKTKNINWIIKILFDWTFTNVESQRLSSNECIWNCGIEKKKFDIFY